MPTLDRVLMKGASANPLPVVWPSLAAKGVKLRAGQVVMLAGEPNAGKSILALAIAAGMRVPTLYLSADTDKFSMLVRGAACITGDSQSAIEDAIRMGNGDYYLSEVAEQLGDIRFTFDPSPSMEDIDLEIRAFTELWGTTPALIVLDNLMNVQGASSGDWAAMLETVQALHHVAHTTDTCILLLHHTSESVSYDICPPRKALQGKVSQLPELILTVARHGDSLAVACVKNRNGKADPTGDTATYLTVDPERMQVTDERAGA